MVGYRTVGGIMRRPMQRRGAKRVAAPEVTPDGD